MTIHPTAAELYRIADCLPDIDRELVRAAADELTRRRDLLVSELASMRSDVQWLASMDEKATWNSFLARLDDLERKMRGRE